MAYVTLSCGHRAARPSAPRPDRWCPTCKKWVKA